jgi:hypothetical protein
MRRFTRMIEIDYQDAPVVVGAVYDHCCPRQFRSRSAGFEFIGYFHEFLAI